MVRRVLVVLCVGCAVLVFGVGSASALYAYPLVGKLTPMAGSFSGLEASSVAVDDANGHTYVAESGKGVVDVFETSTGAQVASWEGSAVTNSPGTPAGSFGGGQVEVAANDASGDVYVLDSTDDVLDVFNGLGGYVCQVTGSSTPSASECNGVAGSGTPAHGFSDPGGVAVDQATGDVYVVDAHHGVVDVFSSAGAYVRQISLAAVAGFGALSETYTRDVAVDDVSGDVFVGDSGRDVVYQFNGTGGYVATLTGANTPARSFGELYVSVAADDTTGDVYVTDAGHHVTDVFGASGGYSAQFSSGYSLGTAVDQATGRIYVSDTGEGAVEVFARALVPDVVTGGVSGLGVRSVTLNGSVNPEGLPVTSCVFEYGEGPGYGQSVPCAVGPGSGSAPVAVSANVSGLEEHATYHYRLVAGNANGETQGADAKVTMPSPPTIDSATAANVGPSSVDLRAAVNPHSAPTSYRFEYGTSTAYGASAPVPDGSIPAGSFDDAVSQHVTGLVPGVTYHWRVVVQNVAGSATGGDHTFVYDTGGAGLPDNRAYEMVTPAHKNAALLGNVLSAEPDVSGDGSRVVLSALQCFGEVASCSVEGNPLGVPYEFSRGSDGWTPTALLPATPEDPYAVSVPLVSADAGTALIAAPTPPVGEDGWYARQADGSLVDIGPIGLYEGEIAVRATSDLSHVVYESLLYRWPFDETEHFASQNQSTSLYEYVGVGNTAPKLVAVSGGAGSTDLISKCGAGLGNGQYRAPVNFGALSADGSTVYFTVTPCVSGSGVNAGVVVPTYELFARVDGSRTVPISVRSPLECTSASCVGSPPADTNFQGASVDGSKAFFLDTQQLTDSASEDSSSGDSASDGGNPGCSGTVGANGCNLYEYDMDAPAGRNLVAVSAGDSSGGGPRVQGVTAISADGSHVYFVARGVLTGVANARGETAQDGAENLYVYERDTGFPAGRVSFIASLRESDEGISGRASYNWTTTGYFDANVTPDGRFLVFMSHAALTADASGAGGLQVFRYDASTGQLVRISVGERGFNDNGNGGVGDASIVPPLVRRLGPPRGDPTMSDDGSYVFFESPVALTPGALDDAPIATNSETGKPEYASNVYEWHEGQVYLLSDGRDTTATQSITCGHLSSVCLLGVDSTGSNVFFSTADQLVAADTDTQVDVYDARVCTAASPCIASPAASPPPCEGEACHGSPGAPPAPLGAATSVFSGPGNIAPVPAPAVKAKAKKSKAKKHKPRPRKRTGKHAKGHKTSRGGK